MQGDLEEIDRGATSKIYKVDPKTALKKYKPGLEFIFKREVEFLRKVAHPNIIKFLGEYSNKGEVGVYLELAEKPLDRRMHDDLSLTTRELFGVQIVMGVAYLHHQKILHRNLNYANTLVRHGDASVAIADFGSATELKNIESVMFDTNRIIDGAIAFTAPEVIEISPDRKALEPDCDFKSEYSQFSDTFAVGKMLLGLITDSFGFMLGEQVENPKRPDNYSDKNWATLQKFWAKHYPERPKMREVAKDISQVKALFTFGK